MDDQDDRNGPSERRIRAALEGRLSPDELTSEEQDIWLAAFSKKMGEPGDAERAFFARRRQLGLGVGLSEDGEIVWASSER